MKTRPEALSPNLVALPLDGWLLCRSSSGAAWIETPEGEILGRMRAAEIPKKYADQMDEAVAEFVAEASKPTQDEDPPRTGRA